MDIKNTAIIGLIVIGAGILAMFVTGILRISSNTEFVTEKPTKLSFMIMNNKSDEEILAAIKKIKPYCQRRVMIA